MDKLGRRNESYVAAVLGGGGGDLLTVYSTTWWLVWHDRYMKVVSQMSPDQLNVMSLPARQFLKANGVETDEDKWKFPTDGLDNLAEEVEVKRERAIQRLNDLQKEMNEKIRSYWEYLSNATLSRQPYPHARNVEIYSDGIFRNQENTEWVITFSIHFDRADDERELVSKYWLRWSSDCTDMGRLEADMPPFFLMQADPLEDKYHHVVGPTRVPAGANCIMLYTADLMKQPYPYPIPLPLPQFRFPKPEMEFPGNCVKGDLGCFGDESPTPENSTVQTCHDLMGDDCCRLPQCVGCKQCSQIRNYMPDLPRARVHAPSEPCTDSWERRGFAARFGFSCATAIKWGLMDCVHDAKTQFCRRTCNFCKYDKDQVKHGKHDVTHHPGEDSDD